MIPFTHLPKKKLWVSLTLLIVKVAQNDPLDLSSQKIDQVDIQIKDVVIPIICKWALIKLELGNDSFLSI